MSGKKSTAAARPIALAVVAATATGRATDAVVCAVGEDWTSSYVCLAFTYTVSVTVWTLEATLAIDVGEVGCSVVVEGVSVGVGSGVGSVVVGDTGLVVGVSVGVVGVSLGVVVDGGR
jgi:hypothetical protein